MTTGRSHMVVFIFHGLRAIYVYIHVIYIVMMRVNQDGGAMDLGVTPVE